MSIIENKTWAHSALKRDISLYQSSENPKDPVIFIGGVHGDEPEGVWLADATLAWLKSNTSQDKIKTEWMLIPCLNPDGVAAHERVNGNGVDLNRNYPSRDWSPKFERPRYNPGPHPGSEPEIKALVQLMQRVRPRLMIHFHSWSPMIVCAGEPGTKAAQALAACSGYDLKPEIGYPTPGSLSQYGWFDNRIPVICIEEIEGCARELVWPHFAPGLIEILTSEEIFEEHIFEY